MTPVATEVTEWLQKAYLDLRSARVLMTAETIWEVVLDLIPAQSRFGV